MGLISTIGIVVHERDRLRFCCSPKGPFAIHDHTKMEEPDTPSVLRIGDCVEVELGETPKHMRAAQRNPLQAVFCRIASPPPSVAIHLSKTSSILPTPEDLTLQCNIHYSTYDEYNECDTFNCALADCIYDCDHVVDKSKGPCLAELKLKFLRSAGVTVFTVHTVIRYLKERLAQDTDDYPKYSDNRSRLESRTIEPAALQIQGVNRSPSDPCTSASIEIEDSVCEFVRGDDIVKGSKNEQKTLEMSGKSPSGYTSQVTGFVIHATPTIKICTTSRGSCAIRKPDLGLGCTFADVAIGTFLQLTVRRSRSSTNAKRSAFECLSYEIIQTPADVHIRNKKGANCEMKASFLEIECSVYYNRFDESECVDTFTNDFCDIIYDGKDIIRRAAHGVEYRVILEMTKLLSMDVLVPQIVRCLAVYEDERAVADAHPLLKAKDAPRFEQPDDGWEPIMRHNTRFRREDEDGLRSSERSGIHERHRTAPVDDTNLGRYSHAGATSTTRDRDLYANGGGFEEERRLESRSDPFNMESLRIELQSSRNGTVSPYSDVVRVDTRPVERAVQLKSSADDSAVHEDSLSTNSRDTANEKAWETLMRRTMKIKAVRDAIMAADREMYDLIVEKLADF